MPISQSRIWAPRRIQYCTRSHLNLENLPRLRPEFLYSKNLGEGVQRRVFHNQAHCQNIPKREVLGEHWLATKKIIGHWTLIPLTRMVIFGTLMRAWCQIFAIIAPMTCQCCHCNHHRQWRHRCVTDAPTIVDNDTIVTIAPLT